MILLKQSPPPCVPKKDILPSGKNPANQIKKFTLPSEKKVSVASTKCLSYRVVTIFSILQATNLPEFSVQTNHQQIDCVFAEWARCLLWPKCEMDHSFVITVSHFSKIINTTFSAFVLKFRLFIEKDFAMHNWKN